ncbi:hypothetical protein BGZ70_003925 [Mortierella alpina]|uniref:Uncharacterized protein n=1 Tax=Mortierella alpina TaxID=64518 RepID=A0A9P6LUV1_MORAP|nr:hypothetical protein BGZ70_003925 [Mortierella alpina]
MSNKREPSPGPIEFYFDHHLDFLQKTRGRVKSRRKVQGDEVAEERGDGIDNQSVDQFDAESICAVNGSVDVFEEEKELLSSWLSRVIYKSRPSKFQQQVIDYLISVRGTQVLSIHKYISFFRATDTSVKSMALAREWNRIKEYFESDDQEEFPISEELVNIPELITAIKAAPTLTPQTIEDICMPPPPLTSRTGSGNSGNSGSSSSGSSGSAKSLSPAQVAMLQKTFEANFVKYQGDEWVLPSGAILDRVLHDAVKDVRYECPLHSFVIQRPSTVLALFEDARDQSELRRVLVDRAEEKLPQLTGPEKALLNIYILSPEELEDLFSKKGWRAVGSSLAEKPSADFERLVYEIVLHLLKIYRQGQRTLPQAPHESWVVNRLWGFLADAFHHPHSVEFQPGEYNSQASSYRRNADRPRDARQFCGHKADGVAVEASRKLELLAIEAAKKDEGPNVTKSLVDGMKLCKLTKDMHDLIRCKARRNVRGRLVTFGIQISGMSATFFCLRQRRGRFYQLCCEGSETLPAVWVNKVGTQGVLEVLTKVLVVRKALLSMAEEVASFPLSSINESETMDTTVDWVAATMTSPQLIPSSPVEQAPKLSI